MANGHLFYASTMNEVGNQTKERLPFWWERDQKAGEKFDWHAISLQAAGLSCSCFTTN